VESTTWTLHDKNFTLEDVKQYFDNIMKDKTMYVIPYYTEWNDVHGIKITDSAFLAVISSGLSTTYGYTVWKTMGEHIEVVIHATDLSILPDEKLVQIGVSPEARATIEKR